MVADRLGVEALVDEMREFFLGDGSASTVGDLCEVIIDYWEDRGEPKCAEYEDVRAACERLVQTEELERTAPETYRAGPNLRDEFGNGADNSEDDDE